MNILYILHTMIRNVYAQYAFSLDYSKARSKKGHGEMFNPNLSSHTTWTFNLLYKL